MTENSPANGALSPRQREVVKLIAEDLTAKEIAERLRISTKTVEFHRSLIKKKIGAAGTAGIVRYGLLHGIIDV